jgi:cell division protease FtsH
MGLWIVAAILMFMTWQMMGSNTNHITPMPYNHFTTNIDDIAYFRLDENQRSFYYKLNDGINTEYQSTFPPGKVTTTIDGLQEQGVSIVVDPPKEPAGMGAMLLMSIIPVIILIAALVWLSKKGTGGATASFSDSPARLINPEDNQTTLEDVAGDFEEVDELIDFLHSPEKFWAANAEMPHGVLFYGPPGCGKTLLAQAIAGEANVPFFVISGSDFVQMFVGVGAARVRSMFEQLKKYAPAILFIDEMDALGSARDNGVGGGSREHSQTLNQLLVEMDGFGKHASVMVIGATNRPELLDPALLRPGRFDRQIAVGIPDVTAREQILKVHTKKHTLADDVDLKIIAKGTPGFSGAELKNLVNEAAMNVARNERNVMEMADLDFARDRVMMGKERTLAMTAKEKEMTAYHEGGHAIAAYHTPEHDPLYKISIVPRGRALGVTMYLPDQDKYSHSYQYLKSQLVSLMGGRAAEELQYGKDAISTGAGNDLERATELARNMVTKWGFSDTGLLSVSERDFELLSETTKEHIDNQVRELLDWAYKEAMRILKEHHDDLHEVAAALVEQETINVKEFLTLIGEETDDNTIEE